MTKDSLTQTEALALLALPDAATATTRRSGTGWLRGNDRKVLLRAIDFDAEEVYLPLMGRTFTISYDKDSVWIQSTADYVPCGWFSPRLIRIEVEQDNATQPIKQDNATQLVEQDNATAS